MADRGGTGGRLVTWLVPALVMALAVGCGQTRAHRQRPRDSDRLTETGRTAKVSGRQAADVQVAFGRSLEDGGKRVEAEAAYREALKRDPKRADAHDRLAVLRDQAGDRSGAARHFAAALRINPRDPEILCDRGYSEYLQRRWADAEASFRRAIALEPGHARSHTNLGLVLARQGERNAALAEFRRAGCDPADALANLGLILALEGHFPEAKGAYAEALAVRPDSAIAREGLRAATVAMAGGRPGPAGDVRTIARANGEAPRADPAVQRASAELPPLPTR